MLLAKPGLDGHDRGIKVIAMALRDAGAEVVYLGLRRSVPRDRARRPSQDDVDVIGISVLSGAHLSARATTSCRRWTPRASDAPIVVGGTIPDADVRRARASWAWPPSSASAAACTRSSTACSRLALARIGCGA